MVAGRLLMTVKRGALRVWLSPLCSRALMVAFKSEPWIILVNTFWIPKPAAGAKLPEGVIAGGKFPLFNRPAPAPPPVKSVGTPEGVALPVCQRTPNCIKAGLERGTKRASMRNGWADP